MRLLEKVAIITGGSGDIGLATAIRFVEEGAAVLLVDLDEQALQNAVDLINSDIVSYVVADVTQPDQVEHYIHSAVERYGGIDIFINNAGIEGEVKAITDYSIDMFEHVMAVNVRGVWLGLKYVIPEMRKRSGGSIVITSSIAGTSGAANFSAYVASKHAVVGLMRSASAECAPLGIRVNTINPGLIETRMMRSIEEQSMPGDVEKAKQLRVKKVPMQRYGTPKEVAQVMLFLASDESSYCTGDIYSVNGGIS